jgi:hypothetical protein
MPKRKIGCPRCGGPNTLMSGFVVCGRCGYRRGEQQLSSRSDRGEDPVRYMDFKQALNWRDAESRSRIAKQGTQRS